MKRDFSQGSPQQFEQAVRRRIEELDTDELPKAGGVESCDNPIMTATEPKVLWDTVEAEFKHRGIECELHPNKDSLTVYIGSSEYTVPYDDLSFDAEQIDDDVEYIVGNICDMEDRNNGQE